MPRGKRVLARQFVSFFLSVGHHWYYVKSRLNRSALRYALVFDRVSNGTLIRIQGRVVLADRLRPDLSPVEFFSLQPEADAQFLLHVIEPSTGRPATEPVPFTTNHAGFFEVAVKLTSPLAAGRYVVRVCELSGTWLSGWANLTVVKHPSLVVLSDIDRTYLTSKVDTLSDVLKVLVQPWYGRQTIPGMRSLMTRLRVKNSAIVAFVSGSPFFFAEVVRHKLASDGVIPDALYMRVFKDVRPPMKPADIDDALSQLRSQYQYKLDSIRDLAESCPPGCRFLLFGDDAQEDLQVYTQFAAKPSNSHTVLGIAIRKTGKRPYFSYLDKSKVTVPLLLHSTTHELEEFIKSLPDVAY